VQLPIDLQSRSKNGDNLLKGPPAGHNFLSRYKKEIPFLSAHSVSDQGCQMVHFLDQISQLGYILEGLGIENVGIFYGDSV
jgi:hypothetical protein